jgi:uncharacterized protein YbjT (DUF2867 family)
VPVVVTGADTPLGAAVVAALCADPARFEVRATVRTRAAVEALARLRIPVAVSDLDDPLRAGAALEGAHTVLHLDPAPLAHVLEAAEDTSVRRVVALAAEPGDGGGLPDVEVVVVAGDRSRADPSVVAALLAADRRA